MVEYSIIIPTYNHLADYLKPCCDSILQHVDLSSGKYEVIIVANGCTDGTETYVKSLNSSFKLLSYDKPLGYTIAVNNGLVAATGKFIILLNNDVKILRSDWIDILRKPFDENLNTGITGPVKFIWNCKGTNRPGIAFWCCMFKRDLLNETGLLDEQFNPGMGEDGEFCVRVQLLGYDLIQVPKDDAKPFGQGTSDDFPIYHVGNGTFADNTQLKDEIIKRNDELLAQKLNTELEAQYYLHGTHKWSTSQLFPLLRKYANRCERITELGVAYIISTFALLAAKPRKLTSYDLQLHDAIKMEVTSKLAKTQGIDFNFIKADDLKTELEETDLLFVDTLHTYQQLSQELKLHANKVRKYIAFHDTDIFGKLDEEPTPLEKRGLLLAINEFLEANPQWKKVEQVHYSYGLFVIERIPKFSIIIPTCSNSDGKIKECIERVIKNTNIIDKEIIVVTNGCDAETMKYLYSLRKVITINNLGSEKKGQVNPVNAGLQVARGEYVVFLDDDSWLLDQQKDIWIQELYKPFEKETVGASSVFEGFYQELGYMLHNGCTMYRKSILQEIGGFDEQYTFGYLFDADISMKIKNKGYELVCVGRDHKYPLFHPESPVNTDNKLKDTVLMHENRDLLYERYAKKPKISVIIPTYNHLEDCLKPCLESMKQYTNFEDMEVIVVANGCKDGTREYVDSLGRPFRLIWIDEGLGYTKATNVGIKKALGEYIILLNNDTQFLDKGLPKGTWVKMLLDPMLKDPKVGITGPLQLHDTYANRDVMIFFCVMIRREIFDKIGLLDESYAPGGGEDIDMCAKAQDLGYKQVVVPDNDLEFTFTNEGRFPIYHIGEGTFNDKEFPEYSRKVIKDNGMLNMIRYNKHIKLNMGSGGVEIPGYVSVDKCDRRAKILSDVFDLKIPDNTVEEIIASHLLEHINPYRVVELLKKWNAMLKPGGKLIIEVPDIEQMCNEFVTGDKQARYGVLNAMYAPVNTTDVGAVSDITSPHLWGWYPELLKEHLEWGGFINISFGPEQIKHPYKNFRAEAYKPNA